MTNRNLLLGITLGVLVPATVLATDLTLPFTFSAGTPIRASEMNATLIAIQTALNSKLDASANLTHSGTRLKSFGLTSADGMSAVHGGSQLFFDSQLGIYCSTDYPDSNGVLRCLPIGDVAAGYFSQSTCAAAAELFVHGSYYGQQAGWPAQTTFYNAKMTSQGVEVRTSEPYVGTVYAADALGTCVVVNPGVQLYRPGSLVAPATFQQLTRTLF